MPTYRSITLSLISQFDMLTIPEYAPPTHSPSTTATVPPNLSSSNDPTANLTNTTTTTMIPFPPTLINPALSLVSIYIPTYANSQFWLRYSIAAPHPPHALYYFKLFIDNTHIVSWGCGEGNQWRGKCMFGLFDGGEDWMRERSVEKRIFRFARDDVGGGGNGESREEGGTKEGSVMEIRVFRAKGRVRVGKVLEPVKMRMERKVDLKTMLNGAGPEGGIDLVHYGHVKPRHPQRYYKYALVDSLDQPFATFRYYFNSWEQLEALGVVSTLRTPTPTSSSSSSNTTDSVAAYVTVSSSPTENTFATPTRPRDDTFPAVKDTSRNRHDFPSRPLPTPPPPSPPSGMLPRSASAQPPYSSPSKKFREGVFNHWRSSSSNGSSKLDSNSSFIAPDSQYHIRFPWLRQRTPSPSPLKQELGDERGEGEVLKRAYTPDVTLETAVDSNARRGRPGLSMLRGVVANAVKRRGSVRSPEAQ
ncbi:MAG: hypothetical protein M1827_004827 [Pycnora praestabilis]|nr:MAG: hypothetical protein M1827_004827 [Pycnora praestabilis]